MLTYGSLGLLQALRKSLCLLSEETWKTMEKEYSVYEKNLLSATKLKPVGGKV